MKRKPTAAPSVAPTAQSRQKAVSPAFAIEFFKGLYSQAKKEFKGLEKVKIFETNSEGTSGITFATEAFCVSFTVTDGGTEA